VLPARLRTSAQTRGAAARAGSAPSTALPLRHQDFPRPWSRLYVEGVARTNAVFAEHLEGVIDAFLNVGEDVAPLRFDGARAEGERPRPIDPRGRFRCRDDRAGSARGHAPC